MLLYILFLSASTQGRRKMQPEDRQRKEMETGLMDRKRQNLQLERESERQTAGS